MALSRLFLVATIFGAATPSFAMRYDNLLAVYQALDVMCRGGSGDDPHTNQACDIRNKASAALKDAGFCFKGLGADSHWTKCK